ncbi:MAG TPA: hypothetical protein VME46_07130 [Acidimicrobiales bacterium]|nr:hypothetical protein [Acidimicrobiales bacterium]
MDEFGTSAEGTTNCLCWLAGSVKSYAWRWKAPVRTRAGLARYLRAAGVEVVEVERANRQVRPAGQDRHLDAIEAARAAQGGRVLGAAKTRDGNVVAIRALVVARRSAHDTKLKRR